MKKEDNIRNAFLFQGLTEDQIKHVAELSVSKYFTRNQIIFAEFDKGDCFYLIVEGMVRVFKLSSSGKEQIIHIFRDGEIFGEVPVFLDGNYPAFATAMKDTNLLLFPKNRFLTLLREDNDLAIRMIATLSQRLKQLVNIIENLSLKEVSGRLATYLFELSEADNQTKTVKLDITKSNLASLLGTIPETLSRAITRLCDEGIIETKGNKSVLIIDREMLQQIASGEERLK